jgi:hypothetical protein
MRVMGRRPRLRLSVPEAAVLILGAVVLTYGLYLLLIGPVLLVLPEGGSRGSLLRAPTLTGVFPIVGSVLAIGGILLGQSRAAWAGIAITGLYGLLYLFGNGGAVVPVAIAQIAAMTRVSSRLRIIHR